MILSITNKIPNFQLLPPCKQFSQIGFQREGLYTDGRELTEIVRTMAPSEYEKPNTVCPERKGNQLDEACNRVLKQFIGENKSDEGVKSNVEK